MLFTAILAATTTPWKNTEKFEHKDDNKVKYVGWLLLLLIVILVIELALAIWAVYLSWTSNSLIEWNAFAKVFFALFAFLFSINYLITHLINKWDLVSYIRTHQVVNVIEPISFQRMAGGASGGATRRRAKA